MMNYDRVLGSNSMMSVAELVDFQLSFTESALFSVCSTHTHPCTYRNLYVFVCLQIQKQNAKVQEVNCTGWKYQEKMAPQKEKNIWKQKTIYIQTAPNIVPINYKKQMFMNKPN